MIKTELYKRFFEQVHRLDPHVQVSRPKEGYAGAHARIPSDVQSILDVGCGNGDFLNHLPDSYQKIGLDFCAEPLKLVRSPAVIGRIDALPFDSFQFDLVTCFELLEHLSYYEFPQALSELERVSQRYIMISVPNREPLHQCLVSCSQCYCLYNPSWHVRSFDESSLHFIFRTFRLIECKRCGPETRSHDSKLVSLYRWWNPRRPPSVAVCPQCGYSKGSETNPCKVASSNGIMQEGTSRGFIQLILRNLVETLLIRYERRPYWLIALYERF
ncbi:MAG: class I SAM-dependent methyltransferase [Candidatus Hodarchaeota archaeon]